jgi:hypothetical protein
MKKIAFALALGGCTTTPMICAHDVPLDKYGRVVDVCRAETPDWSRPVVWEREDRDDRDRRPKPEPKPEKPETKPEKPKPKPETKPGKPDPCACGPELTGNLEKLT